jgi:transcriptional regulator with XRE-family HTH domain
MKKLTAFGEHFRTLRIKTGLSEKELAEKVKKSQSYISAIESKEIPFLNFDFIMACMDAFELKGDERHEFLVKAMSCSQRMSIPLTGISIIPQERFLQFLSYILLNYKPVFNSKSSWINNCLDRINEVRPYVIV